MSLRANRNTIENDFGSTLDWRGPEAGGLRTKRTKVVAPKVAVGDRSNPTPAGLQALADSAQRLVKAVQPHLQAANETAATALLELESEADEPESSDDGSVRDEDLVSAPEVADARLQ